MVPQLDAQLLAKLRTAFAAQLPSFLPRQRWFRSKARRIQSAHLADCIPLPLSQSVALIAFAFVEFSEGGPETYVLPLIAPHRDRAAPQESVVIRLPVSDPASEQPFVDALAEPEFLAAILNAIAHASSFSGENGILRASPEGEFEQTILSSATAQLPPLLLKGEQSNSSVVFGDRLFLKVFRRLEEGEHPDVEVGRFLTSVARFENVPPLCGSLVYQPNGATPMTVGILQRFVPNRGDAWGHTLEFLSELFAPLKHPTEGSGRALIRPSASKANSNVTTFEVPARLAKELELIRLLGTRTAELHLALASSSSDPAFAPEPFTPEIQEGMESVFHDLVVQNFATVRLKIPELPGPVADLAREILKLEDHALLVSHSVLENQISSIRIRIHGDYHLGQVLFTGSDFFIIDFEGEPARSLSARRNKRSPLQDVAGMLRSFHYAAFVASISARQQLAEWPGAESRIATLAAQWQTSASAEFLRSYRGTIGDAKFVPSDAAEFDALLKVFLLEKAVYELGYELNNRPSWLAIPLEGIRDILSRPATPA